MIEFNDFVEMIKKNVEKRVAGDGLSVELRTVVKSCDRTKQALIINRKDHVCAPTIYLEDFYNMYENGTPMDIVTEYILDYYNSCKNILQLDYDKYFDLKNAQDNITFRVMNYSVNEKYLEDAAYIKYLDLAIVFYCTTISQKQHIYSSKISNQQIKEWGIDTDFLWNKAQENTKRMFGIKLQEVRDVFREMLELDEIENNDEILEAIDDAERAPMYILSNSLRNQGAVVMFMDDVLEGLAHNLKDDLYIIPSSIHEVMAIPVHARLKREEVDAMIQDINIHLLEPEDILSNHVYVYSRELNKIID